MIERDGKRIDCEVRDQGNVGSKLQVFVNRGFRPGLRGPAPPPALSRRTARAPPPRCAGPRGPGQAALAETLAQALNCERGPTTSPCKECESCRTIHDATSIDVIELDAASHRGIDDIREIRDRVALQPVRGRRKVRGWRRHRRIGRWFGRGAGACAGAAAVTSRGTPGAATTGTVNAPQIGTPTIVIGKP